MVNFRKNSQKKLDTLFAKWWFLFFKVDGVYACKSKRLKNMQDYTPKKFWILGIFLNWGKHILSQPLPFKKNSCEICNIFYQQIFFFIYFFFIVIGFFIYTKLKSYEDSYFSVFFKDYRLLNMSKTNRKVEIINPLRNKPNTAITKNTL